jgi:hypothetical protein
MASSGGTYRFAASDLNQIAVQSDAPSITDNLETNEAALVACEAFVLARRRECALSCQPVVMEGHTNLFAIACDQTGDLLPLGCLSAYRPRVWCPLSSAGGYTRVANSSGHDLMFEEYQTLFKGAEPPFGVLSDDPAAECEDLAHDLRLSCFPPPEAHNRVTSATAPTTREASTVASSVVVQGDRDSTAAIDSRRTSGDGSTSSLPTSTLTTLVVCSSILMAVVAVVVHRSRKITLAKNTMLQPDLAWDDAFEIFDDEYDDEFDDEFDDDDVG